MSLKNRTKKFLNNLYNYSPLPRIDKNFLYLKKEIRDIEKIQYYSRQKLDKYQDFHFRRLIICAYNKVPYYHKWFRTNDLSINDVRTVADIIKLPILTKKIIRENYKEFLAQNNKEYKPVISMTSGSSGIPFKFLIDRYANLRYNASLWRILRIEKVKFRDKYAILRGTLVHLHSHKNQPIWRNNYFEKSIAFNTFHMNEENCKIIIAKLREFQPTLLFVYPMALFILSHYLKKYDVKFPKLKLILSSSESFSQENRDYITKIFQCPIIDFYGQSELSLCAYECKHESGYHAEEENNILEVLDKNSEQVGEGKAGRIVGTNLHNYSMPLIRYSTEDLAEMGAIDCLCGRHSKKLRSIQGRILDHIITKDKSLISGISFYHYWKHRISEKIPNISFVQIIQPKIDEIIVRILPGNNYSNKDEKMIIQELKKFVGNLNISFEYINERSFGEKWRFTISKISDETIKKLMK